MPRWSSTRTISRRAGVSTAVETNSGSGFRRGYAKNPPPRARWRIACIFVDKRHRGRGVARAGLEGALAQIAAAGGGLVEAISEVTVGREAQGRFLFSGTVELFEQYGFTRGRQVGKHAWIVSRGDRPRRVGQEGTTGAGTAGAARPSLDWSSSVTSSGTALAGSTHTSLNRCDSAPTAATASCPRSVQCGRDQVPIPCAPATSVNESERGQRDHGIRGRRVGAARS